MANGLSGLAQAALGGIQAGAQSLAEQGRERQVLTAQEEQRQKDIAAQRELAKEKAAREREAATLAHKRALELQRDKISGEGEVKKEIKQLDIAGRFDVAKLQTTTQTNIANQKNDVEQKKVKITEAKSDFEREKFEKEYDLSNRKLQQQVTYQTRLNEISDIRNSISQEQNEIARNRLQSELEFKQAKFEQDKKIDEKRLKLDEKRLELDSATSGLKKRRLEKEIAKIENDVYQSQKTDYEKYLTAKDASDKALAAADALLKNREGLTSAAGFESNLLTVGGSQAANFEAALESFKGKLFTQVIQQMRGLGSLSDAEGKKIIAATKALSLNMSDQALFDSLNELRGELSAAQERTNQLAVPRPVRPGSESKPEPEPVAAPTNTPPATDTGGGDQEDFSNLWS